MKISPRKFALSIAAAAALTTLGACRDDTSKPVGDVLAQDSSLDLAVMSASGDSSPRTGADTPTAVTTVAPTRSIPAAVPSSAPVARQPRAAVQRVASAPVTQRVNRPRSNAQATRRERQSVRLIRSASTSTRAQPARVTTVYRKPAREVARNQSPACDDNRAHAFTGQQSDLLAAGAGYSRIVSHDSRRSQFVARNG